MVVKKIGGICKNISQKIEINESINNIFIPTILKFKKKYNQDSDLILVNSENVSSLNNDKTISYDIYDFKNFINTLVRESDYVSCVLLEEEKRFIIHSISNSNGVEISSIKTIYPIKDSVLNKYGKSIIFLSQKDSSKLKNKLTCIKYI